MERHENNGHCDDFIDESEDDEFDKDEAIYDGDEDDSIYDDKSDIDNDDEFYSDGDRFLTSKKPWLV